ncbi:MAG: ATP-binding protein [Oscillospiraceae bacterium]|nr:ATP-binding protein [Oscillospiraceae bacterium]
MPHITAIIGKVCAGKTTHANTLPGVLLSVDDFMLPLFGQHCEIIEAKLGIVQGCLLQQAAQLISKDIDVVLDWGFWRRAEREKVAAFCTTHGIELRWHDVSISQEQRQAQIARRNAEIERGLSAYYVSPGLFAKCNELFEEPEEIDGLIRV